ncbi:hypothetical protein SLH49_21945 [Cognatiyoonia sp. IB215446]|uniref:hypothetical protein n=1 Tax=Cognatiyoonia sp. IB215446 TaxID=3097355 RepID=UPI002A10F3D0|nr:hypothetical protein [Cognatiyoonia sp. IB215446]MDX8350661.1 hypothetical protein [Cognatiyoonia sp. IB215446]
MKSAEETSKAAKLNLAGLLGVVDRAWEGAWAARVVCLVLFFDTCMLLSLRVGIVDWATTGSTQLNFGWFIVALTAYCLVAGLIFPPALDIIRSLTIQMAPSRSFTNERQLKSVYSTAILDKALRAESQFWLDYYQDRVEKKRSSLANGEAFAGLLVATLCLTCVNGMIGQWYSSNASIVSGFFLWSGNIGILAAMVVVSGALGTVFQVWTASPTIHIYDPELAAETENERIKNLKDFQAALAPQRPFQK